MEQNLKVGEIAVLASTDHNVLPLKTEVAFGLSTSKVLVIPGIEWNLHKTVKETASKLCTRREIITLGNQDNLAEYIREKTSHSLKADGTLTTRLTEDEMLDYIASCESLAIVVPHPSHVFVEYYDKHTIKDLFIKLKERKIKHPFFVEEEGGYDPFPRLFYSYEGKYPVIGGSDAHRLHSFFNISAVFSVKTSIEDSGDFAVQWEKVFQDKDLLAYKRLMTTLFATLKDENEKIVVKKYHFKSIVSFLRCIPNFVQNRFVDFPHRLLK